MRKIRKFITGITLIEMLIVLIITAVLSTVMIPKIAGHRTRARLKGVYTIVEVIQVAEKHYYSKHGDYYDFGGPNTMATNTYEDGEEALNIIIPKSNDIIYEFFAQGFRPAGEIKGLQIYFYEKGHVDDGWFLKWRHDFSTGNTVTVKEPNHRLAPYVTADGVEMPI